MDADNKLKKLKRWTSNFNRALAELSFGKSVSAVYNPLDYAREVYFAYWQRYGFLSAKRNLFMGMNPGPYGMAQTGIPFGEVSMVRDWMKLQGRVKKPQSEHPKRPILGFACPRSEVSGKRLWGFLAKEFSQAEDFFKNNFVHNYCPLVFMSASGANLTPDKFRPALRRELERRCDDYFLKCLSLLNPQVLIGVGGFAHARLTSMQVSHELPQRVCKILHPSPASPAANHHWSEQVQRTLQKEGVVL